MSIQHALIAIGLSLAASVFAQSKASPIAGDVSDEARSLIEKPLTKSTAEKHWPKSGMRGIYTFSIAPIGANTQDPGGFLKEAQFRKFKEWGVNLITVSLSVDAGSAWDVKRGTDAPPVPADDALLPYRQNLNGLKIALHLGEKYDIKIIAAASGKIIGRSVNWKLEPGQSAGYRFEDETMKIASYIAYEFGDHPMLLGINLMDEPNTKEEVERWQSNTIPLVTSAIRRHDTNTYILIMPAPWGLPGGFSSFTPVKDPKIVYVFHGYYPHSYVHQGIGGYVGDDYTNKSYPGGLRNFKGNPAVHIGREELEANIAEAVAFKKKNDCIMLCGAFSVVRWAPGGAAWVKDCIDIFEKHGISWSYFAYRGWNGWNPTFGAGSKGSNNSDGGEMTERLKVLIEAWKKNTR
ncbi:MAG: cellulase family glycosylhydrolase [Spirochaetota bacterium]